MRYFDPNTGRFQIDDGFNFDPNAYTEELIAGAEGITEDEKRVLSGLMSKPEVQTRLRNSVALRSEASRKLDAARAIADEATQVRDENFQWARTNRRPADPAPQPAPVITQPGPTGLTMADVQRAIEAERAKLTGEFTEIIGKQDNAFLGVLADTVDLTEQYKELFGSRLPYAELQKFALENRMPLSKAFPLFVAPKLEEKRKEELSTIRKTAFEEGRQAALSEREETGSAGPESKWQGPGTGALGDVLMNRNTQRLKDSAGKELVGEDAFVQSWNKTRGFTQKDGH